MWTLNFLFVAAGYRCSNLLPPFVRDHGDISERQIGFIFFFNTLAVVLAQLPMSRWLERRRLRALALMPAIWAVAWLGVDASLLLEATAAFIAVSVCVIAIGVAECFHGPAHQALVGALGGDRLRGRYFALHSLVGARRHRGTCGRRSDRSRPRRSRSGRSRPLSASQRSARSRSTAWCRRTLPGSRARTARRIVYGELEPRQLEEREGRRDSAAQRRTSGFARRGPHERIRVQASRHESALGKGAG